MSAHQRVVTILLLPHDAHRTALLAPGVLLRSQNRRYGWVATVQGTPWLVFDDGEAGRRPGGRERDHLVLARDRAVVLEGVDRLGRHMYDVHVQACVEALLGVEQVHGYVDRNEALEVLGRLGTIVLIDAEGREVTA